MTKAATSSSMEIADTLWTTGAGHVIGAKALAAEAHRWAVESGKPDVHQAAFNGKYSASIHLLVGFGFELLLKAAYLSFGGTPSLLHRKIGHDLVRALDEAERAGFQSATPNLRWVIERIREPHLGHQFRYGGQSTVEMPGLELSLPILEGLAYQVGNHLHAD